MYIASVTTLAVGGVLAIGFGIATMFPDARTYSLRCITGMGVTLQFSSDHPWRLTEHGYSSEASNGALGDLWIKDTAMCERASLSAEEVRNVQVPLDIKKLLEELPLEESHEPETPVTPPEAVPDVPGGNIDPNLWLRPGTEPRVAEDAGR